jgi:hypothetical protein
MKFTTLIPVYFNDGSEVPNDTLQAMIDELAREFGGCSDEGITRGQWIDPADATLFRDECRRITVFCDRTMLDDARAAVVRIGRQLRQWAMYFEVRDYDGVQILEMPFA